MSQHNPANRTTHICTHCESSFASGEQEIPKGWKIVDDPEDGKILLCDSCLKTSNFVKRYMLAHAKPTQIRIADGTGDYDFGLRSGAMIDLSDPDYSRVEIRDIAAGLARECRFAGQMHGYYTVAQHCVIGTLIAPQAIKYAFLMHDAAEAILKDIPKPLKNLLPDYQRIEAMHEERLNNRFMVPTRCGIQVKRIDTIMLAAENVAIRNQKKRHAYRRLRAGDAEAANQAVDLIKAGHNKSWERPFLERFHELAPIEALETGRIAA